jgi:hypothetical protein
MNEVEPVAAKDLIVYAAKRGTLSRQSADSLQQSWVVEAVEEALDDSYGIEQAGEVLLVTMMPDDSTSMTIQGKNLHVISGHNELLKGMRGSPVANRVLLQTRLLNGKVLNPFRPLSVCEELSAQNYACIHGTPLFEQTMITLGTVMAKTEELLEQGAARVRTATLIMTDAESTDERASELRPEVASVVRDMRRVGDHIVAGMGFSSGSHDSYYKIFREMGIDEVSYSRLRTVTVYWRRLAGSHRQRLL